MQIWLFILTISFVAIIALYFYKGINDLRVKDCYYSHIIKYSNLIASVFKATLQWGYDNSIRESIS
jgi:hypothetical protein